MEKTVYLSSALVSQEESGIAMEFLQVNYSYDGAVKDAQAIIAEISGNIDSTENAPYTRIAEPRIHFSHETLEHPNVSDCFLGVFIEQVELHD